MSESLKTYTCGVMTCTPSLSSKWVRPLDHLGEELTHPPASNYSKGGFSTSGYPSRGRGMLTPRIHCYDALDITYNLHPNLTFVSLLMLRLDQSILPVFKRLAACFDPSRQSLAPSAQILYRHPLTQLALLDSFPFRRYTTQHVNNCRIIFFYNHSYTVAFTLWVVLG